MTGIETAAVIGSSAFAGSTIVDTILRIMRQGRELELSETQLEQMREQMAMQASLGKKEQRDLNRLISEMLAMREKARREDQIMALIAGLQGIRSERVGTMQAALTAAMRGGL